MPYVWELDSWPDFTWEPGVLLDALGKARLAQGRLLSKVNALKEMKKFLTWWEESREAKRGQARNSQLAKMIKFLFSREKC